MFICCVVIFLHFFKKASKSCDLRDQRNPQNPDSIELTRCKIYTVIDHAKNYTEFAFWLHKKIKSNDNLSQIKFFSLPCHSSLALCCVQGAALCCRISSLMLLSPL